MSKIKLKKCPHCGSLTGYHDKCIVSIGYVFEWDGEPCGATEGNPIRGGDKFYCCECGKDVTKYVKEVKKCRVCGCTDHKACLGGCYWIEDDLCSRCKS